MQFVPLEKKIFDYLIYPANPTLPLWSPVLNSWLPEDMLENSNFPTINSSFIGLLRPQCAILRLQFWFKPKRTIVYINHSPATKGNRIKSDGVSFVLCSIIACSSLMMLPKHSTTCPYSFTRWELVTQTSCRKSRLSWSRHSGTNIYAIYTAHVYQSVWIPQVQVYAIVYAYRLYHC